MPDHRSPRPRVRRPSPSMAVSLLALFIALGGTAVAATVISSTKQIRNGVVRSADLRDGTVSTKDLRDATVTSEDLRDGTVQMEDLQSSARTAIEAAGTQALEAFRRAGPEGVPAGEPRRVATLRAIPAGTYALFAKTVLTATHSEEGLFGEGKSVGAHCVLEASGDEDQSRALLGAPGANSPGQVNLQLTRTFESTGEASLTCDAQKAVWRASDTSIIALRVGAAPRQSVED